jgi:hypothetical protein
LRLSTVELEQAVSGTDAPVCLVAARVLRRVVRQHRNLTGLQLDVPHGDVYVIAREPLLQYVTLDEIGFEAKAAVPERVILVTRPDLGQLESESPAAILTKYWRLILHGMVHLTAEQRIARGELSDAQVRCSIRDIGLQQFAEMHDVLQDEGLLFDAGQRASLVEATAVFWEFFHFSPETLLVWFPGIKDWRKAEGVFRTVVDPDPLLRASRPTGARRPSRSRAVQSLAALKFRGSLAESVQDNLQVQPSESDYRKLGRWAKKARERGNLVRALILWTRARYCAPKEVVGRARATVRDNVDALAFRLLAALEQPQADPDTWHEPLVSLVKLAAHGFWTVEARLLYDLQRVCIDRERRLYRVDLGGWLTSLGRSPLQRPLPHQQNVLICRHLQSARRRLVRVRLSEEDRQRLDGLLGTAAQKAEGLVRSEMRPIIREAIQGAGLCAENLPERVAVRKLVEELLDRIVQRGFTTMGSLRDAVARNYLKLPDLASPQALIYGDLLLRVDRQLAKVLDRVHRRGEFYLRGMQVVSSLGFGTPWGRFVTRYLAVPFGGAYVLEAGLQHVLHKLTGFKETTSPLAVFLLGIFFLGLVNSRRFRGGFVRLLRSAFRAARFCIIELPQKMVNIPLVHRVLHSPWFRLTYRLVAKPLLFTLVICLVVSALRDDWRWSTSQCAMVFLAVAVVVNSRFGRDMEEIATDWMLQVWERLGPQLFVALFQWVMDLSRRAIDAVDRFLYAVDEFLRFRTGERGALVALKAAVSPAWFLVNYVVRSCVSLLVEPQVNPIKHFPVVTVSHKILLPFIPALAGVLSITMDKATAYFVAGAVIALIPGAFGFLVWELRENWRMYRANRPEELLPVPVGPHGETIARLLKPGFHSGTIPKRYAKLRRTEKRAAATGNWASVRGHLHALEEVSLSFRRYVDRDLVWLLDESDAWPHPELEVKSVRAGTNQLAAEIAAAGSSCWQAVLEFDLRSGRLMAAFDAPDGRPSLSPEQRNGLKLALIGLYKTAGVEIVREAVERCLSPDVVAYDPQEHQIVFWIGPACQGEVSCELGENDSVLPASSGVDVLRPGAKLDLSAFAKSAVSHRLWSEAWSRGPGVMDECKGVVGSSIQVLPDEP